MSVYKPVKASRFMERILLELTPKEFIQLNYNVNWRSDIIVTEKILHFSIVIIYNKYMLLLSNVLVYCKTDKELELPEKPVIFMVDKFYYSEI